ncbi:PREDICTED: probable serine/threonine-protein kinase DDB_G0282963 isoform X3 [Trachymyrmex cornetzi]|uniref:probable serine/threonine-protein kinase DDB_G0282963 isoform X3 n=1 Tax=Trachymyrmex cornetzi TaxID=471704 RepID=UPI00084F59C6|nr:PREDICTED: probable serine/threonine-protein kinase DDB_G0282963 isoform X3 [Trachymyrmex cornetzi]
MAIAITFTILIRIKYCKNMHTKHVVLNKQILNKVGYKIQDLELKINVLTYKMQYGTWPLPHQICNLNPKLRKIKMTLSNPGDRKNWLKHVLLNPSSESKMYAPCSKTFRSSEAKLMNDRFDIKQEHVPQHIKHSELSTACSSIETLKSTSDQSVNVYSARAHIYPQNVSTKKNDLSRSKNTLQRRNVQLLPLNSNVINHQSSKITPSSMQKDVYAINAKYNPCQKFTETIYKCKSFLKELQRNDKYLRSLNRPSKMSKVSSLKTAHTAGQTALSTTEERETFCGASVIAKKEEINETECVKRMQGNMVKDTEETYHQNKPNVSKDVVALKTNNRAPTRDIGISVIPIKQPTQNIHPSQETLIEVRKRLQNLHNVLQTYQDTSRSTKRQESTNQINEIDSFITYPVMKISSEYFELSRSEDSLSSLADSSHTSKTYQRSNKNLTLRNTYSKGFSQHDTRSNLPAFVLAEPHLCSRNTKLQTSESYENEYKECLWENTLDRNCNHKIESNPEVNKDAIKTNTLFNTRDNISEAISERIFYILSPENKDNQIQNEALLEERFATKKFSNTFDKEQYRENMTISQNNNQSKISNNSNNRENKSTVLLLQEALHFKNTLLTHSRTKCPISNGKQGNIVDESSLISNNNFPSMIIDIKEEEPIVSNSYDKINQRYICLEMKQRRDLFPQYLKKVNTLAHCEDEQNTKSQDYIRETSSEYFSITDLASHNNNNDEIKNNVSLKPPIYEKVISITIPVDMDERSMKTKTVLQNIRTCVQENLRENATSDIDNNIADKSSPTMLKFEDLILERVKNIRDYMDTFLQSQNIAIFKARRALQCQGKNDIFRCSDEASHVVVYNRSIAPSSSNSTDQIIGSSKKSSDILTNTWPNYIEEYKQETENYLKCSSDLHLKRNPGMFELITPIKNKFSIKNNTQQFGIPTELEKEEIDLSLPEVLTYSHKIDSKSTHKISDSITSRRKEHSNTENSTNDKGIIVDVNADFHKRKKQTQVTESKPSIISYFSLDVANADAKVIHTAREDYLMKSNCNSISHSNSYFTDEEIISDVKMDNVSSKSISDMKHSHLKLNVQKETKQNVTKQQISVDECPNTNIVTSSEEPSEYSNLTILINSNLILDKSKCDYSTNPKTTSSLMMLKENDFIFDPAASLLPLSLNKENETLNTDSTLLNNLKQNNEISIDIANLSPRIERYSTKPFQTYSQVKTKSDMSLITNRRKDLKVDIYPKKSPSFLMRHNTRYISGTLHQPYTKLHNDKNKCVKNKLRLITQSKSIISPQRVSTKSCIPIFKNRLESSHRMKHQEHARSPLRSPLTMLGEKTCTKVHATDEEVVRNDNVSINRHLHVERTMSNLTKLNLEKNIFNKDSEKLNMTFKENTSKKHSGIMFSDQNVKSLAIDKEHSDKSDIYGSKSDTSIMQHIKKIASKEMIVISIMANDDLRKKYPADLFILNTKNISPTTDLLIHKNKLWTVTVEKKEKEVTAKPSITDTCTSMSNLQ